MPRYLPGQLADLTAQITNNDAACDFAAGAPNRVMNGHSAAGAFQEFLGQVNGTPVFQLGFDEKRVNGIQPRRAGAPAPMTCTAID